MAETIVKVLLVVSMTLGIISGAAAQDAEERYSKSCAVCHAAGAAGAPKAGVAEEWAPRLEKGMDVLVKSVENGMNAMPPKGMCFDCTAEDYQALIILMSTPK